MNLLIIESDQKLLDLYLDQSRELGYKVHGIKGIEVAQLCITTIPYNLILVDANLECNFKELLWLIRILKRNPNFIKKVYILTESPDEVTEYCNKQQLNDLKIFDILENDVYSVVKHFIKVA